MRSGEVWSSACAPEPVDCLSVSGLGDYWIVFQERSRTCLEPERPLRRGEPSPVHKPLQRSGGSLVLTAPRRRLDELDKRPRERAYRMALARALCRVERSLVLSRSVVHEGAGVVEVVRCG